jgi:hypothetical protein
MSKRDRDERPSRDEDRDRERDREQDRDRDSRRDSRDGDRDRPYNSSSSSAAASSAASSQRRPAYSPAELMARGMSAPSVSSPNGSVPPRPVISVAEADRHTQGNALYRDESEEQLRKKQRMADPIARPPERPEANPTPPVHVEIHVVIPAAHAGALIGKGGSSVKRGR